MLAAIPSPAAVLPAPPGSPAPSRAVAGASASAAPPTHAGQPASSASYAVSSAGADALSGSLRLELLLLQRQDQDVRSQEAAHQEAGGSLVSGASYEYQQGPDGRAYAVHGAVSIDVAIVPGDPQATVARMRQVQDAALAPTQPSAQDERIAAEAGEIALTANQQIIAQQLARAATAAAAATATAATTATPQTGSGSAASASSSAAAASTSGVLMTDRQRQERMVAAYAAASAGLAADDAQLTRIA